MRESRPAAETRRADATMSGFEDALIVHWVLASDSVAGSEELK